MRLISQLAEVTVGLDGLRSCLLGVRTTRPVSPNRCYVGVALASLSHHPRSSLFSTGPQHFRW